MHPPFCTYRMSAAELDDVFQAPTKPPAACVKHWIELIDPDQHIPRFRTYHMSAAELDELKCQIDDMLKKGWISPSTSPYGYPMLFACKK